VLTTDLIRVASATADDLVSTAEGVTTHRVWIDSAARTIRSGISTGRALRDESCRRAFVCASLQCAGETLRDAIDRHPEMAASLPALRDDALACLSLAMAAREAP